MLADGSQQEVELFPAQVKTKMEARLLMPSEAMERQMSLMVKMNVADKKLIQEKPFHVSLLVDL